MHLALLTLTLLSQTPSPAADAPSAAESATVAAERAALAAERAALQAERAALSAERAAVAAGAQLPGTGEARGEHAAVTSPGPDTRPVWSGTAGMGFMALTGNAQSLTFSTLANAERKGPQWILAARMTAAYGTARPADEPDADADVVALNALAELRGDRRVSKRVSLYVLSGVDTDHVKSIEARGWGEGGTGLIWADVVQGKVQRLLLRTDLAFRYARESRFQYYPTPVNLADVDFVAPRLAVAFRYGLSESTSFLTDAEVLPNVTGDSRVLVNTLSKLTTRVTERVGLSVSFQVKHDSEPAAGKRPTDTALAANVEVGF